jgi:aspartate aminotransferase-like enzyme
MALSERAWSRAREVRSRNFYFNLIQEREKCLAGQTLFTPAVNLIVALDECLKYFQEQGLQSIFNRQRAMTLMVRTGVRCLGLELLAESNYTWGLTSIKLLRELTELNC